MNCNDVPGCVFLNCGATSVHLEHIRSTTKCRIQTYRQPGSNRMIGRPAIKYMFITVIIKKYGFILLRKYNLFIVIKSPQVS